MTQPINLNPASFRDPKGRIFHDGEKILRAIYTPALRDFEFVRANGFIHELIAKQKLLPEIKYSSHILQTQDPKINFVLEHPRLRFISYPYEWPFALLKSAALFYLDLHLAALENNITLSDASAYNIQFMGVKPIFIDHLSFCRYEPDSLWFGYKQFCEQFLNPLLLSNLDIGYHAWYRGNLSGISAQELRSVLPWHYKFFPKIFLHVILQSQFQQTNNSKLPKFNLPLNKLKKLLQDFYQWINSLEIKNKSVTVWQSYKSSEQDNQATKQQLIREFIGQIKPDLLYDLGCNSGEYAELALQSGAKTVIGFDSDAGVLNQAFLRARDKNLNFLPLLFDLSNPSPAQGWMQQERMGLLQRGPADAVLALAVIHHLFFTHHIPLSNIIDWLLALAPTGMVEFVAKEDPRVQGMLQLREDIFPDYNLSNFLNLLALKAKIIKTVSVNHRTLIWYQK